MKKKIHMIGNAHLDPVWLWNWREGFQENKATFLSALERLEEFDDFVFTSSSAQFYLWIEQNEPEMFLRIQKQIAAGRWVLCGGWWVQPDCNIPSGESFARHALLAQNYFYEKFGVIARTGYCVDSFGHNGMMPQILRKSGMDRYVFMRPGPHEKELPARTFIWESPDGSRVKAFRLPFSYGIFKNLSEEMDRVIGEFAPGIDHMMLYYGVGNHGGGPTIENIKTIRELQKTRQNVEITFSHPDQFFDEIEDCTLPVVKDDLQHHAAGCYAAESMIKEMNRKSENALLCAEKLSVLAVSQGKGEFSGRLTEAWQQLLFNQFHDTLAGSSVKAAYFDARNQLGEVMAVADRAATNALQALTFDIDIPLDASTLPIVVFNPHAWEVTTPVEFETGLFANGISLENAIVADVEGNKLPCQVIDASCKVPGRHRLTFIAKLPAMGYSLFIITPQQGEAEVGTTLEAKYLENELLKVTFDEKTGAIASIFDKERGMEVLSGPCRARVIDDDTDTWGHTLTKLDDEVGEFTLLSMKVMDVGAVRSCIRISSRFEQSTLIQTYTLYKGSRKIVVATNVNWQERRRALKLDVPVAGKNPVAVCEIPFGYIQKEQNGWEEPMQGYADLSCEGNGLSVLNDSKYSVDFRPGTIGLTALRSPVYAHHDPYQLREDEEYSYIDQGISEFTYVLLPHAGNFKKAGVIQAAALLNQPIISTFETFHKGKLPQSKSFMQVNKENIILTALKRSYHNEGIAVRLYEAFGEATEVEISLLGQTLATSFAPFEIKTFVFNKNNTIEEVNFLERGL